jgi:hypothetical protein
VRQFVVHRQNFKLSAAQKELIGDLFLERISLEGICRVLKITAYHLYLSSRFGGFFYFNPIVKIGYI